MQCVIGYAASLYLVMQNQDFKSYSQKPQQSKQLVKFIICSMYMWGTFSFSDIVPKKICFEYRQKLECISSAAVIGHRVNNDESIIQSMIYVLPS